MIDLTRRRFIQAATSLSILGGTIPSARPAGMSQNTATAAPTVAAWSFALVGKELDLGQVGSGIDALAEAGTRLISLQIYEAYLGRLYYPSQKYPEFVLKERAELTRRMYEACLEKGIRVWMHCDERAAPYGSALHRRFEDCAERNARGGLCPMWDGVLFCLHSRYRDFLAEIYQEALEQFPRIEGIVLADESGFLAGDESYCDRCRHRFITKHGIEPPREPAWEDPDSAWWKFMRDRMEWWTEYIDFLARSCKRVRPGIHTTVMINPHGLAKPVLAGVDWWEVARLDSLDGIGTAFHFRHEDHPLSIGHAAAFVSQVARSAGKAAFLKLAAHREVSGKDLRFSAYHSALHGVETVIFVNLESLLCSSDTRQDFTQACSNIRRLPKHACDQSRIEYGGLWYSRSQLFQQWSSDARPYNREGLGIFQAFSLHSLPIHFVFDEDLEEKRLQALRVLFFPVSGQLDPRQQRVLIRFVEEGGGLVCSLMRSAAPSKSLQDLLSSLFGSRYEGLTPPIQALRLADASHGSGRNPNVNADLPVYQYPDDAGSLSYFSGRQAVRQGHRRAAFSLSNHAGQMASLVGDNGVLWPAIITRRHGKGRAVLFTEPLGSMFNGLAEHATGLDSHWLRWAKSAAALIARSITWAAGSEPLVIVRSQAGNISSRFLPRGKSVLVVLVNNGYFDSDRVTLKAPLDRFSEREIHAEGLDDYDVRSEQGQLMLSGSLGPSGLATIEFPHV